MSDATQAAGTVDQAISRKAVNPQTGTAYTLAATDVDKIVEMNNASANTVTVPQDSALTSPIHVGATIEIVQTGAGLTTVAAGSGATVNGRPGLKSGGQWARMRLTKRAANTWLLDGDISA